MGRNKMWKTLTVYCLSYTNCWRTTGRFGIRLNFRRSYEP